MPSAVPSAVLCRVARALGGGWARADRADEARERAACSRGVPLRLAPECRVGNPLAPCPLPPAAQAWVRAQRDMRREVRLMSRLKHAHSVRLFEAFGSQTFKGDRATSKFHIVMEWAGGQWTPRGPPPYAAWRVRGA